MEDEGNKRELEGFLLSQPPCASRCSRWLRLVVEGEWVSKPIVVFCSEDCPQSRAFDVGNRTLSAVMASRAKFPVQKFWYTRLLNRIMHWF
ncbi:hypothetical protein V6N13_137503 [Hibiscus sabdariffa]|uniref:Uncharacterized protein n=1 Tax=Hibiscus sabdariffa TaxID=183260 RepID=A0ABR2DKG3_9ROSI